MWSWWCTHLPSPGWRHPGNFIQMINPSPAPMWD
jgi:hypothetical protein